MVAKKCNKCLTTRPIERFRKYTPPRVGRSPECDVCRSARRRARYQSDEEYRRRVLDKQRVINAANPERNREKAKAWSALNPDRVKANKTASRRKDLAAYNAYQSDWRKANKGDVNAHTARRHAAKMRAMPAWADRAAINLVYKKAATLGMHVDHIVPLQSKTVCGLHVHANLQLLAPSENISKNNRCWPDMP